MTLEALQEQQALEQSQFAAAQVKAWQTLQDKHEALKLSGNSHYPEYQAQIKSDIENYHAEWGIAGKHARGLQSRHGQERLKLTHGGMPIPKDVIRRYPVRNKRYGRQQEQKADHAGKNTADKPVRTRIAVNKPKKDKKNYTPRQKEIIKHWYDNRDGHRGKKVARMKQRQSKRPARKGNMRLFEENKTRLKKVITKKQQTARKKAIRIKRKNAAAKAQQSKLAQMQSQKGITRKASPKRVVKRR